MAIATRKSRTAPRSPGVSATRVVELAVNLDDLTGQLIGEATQRLLDEGALDVWTIAIGMKKQRPGVMLCVLAHAGERNRFARRILELTGSFGVRFREWDRLVLDREHADARGAYGTLRVKVGRLSGRTIVARPEFEDVKALAREAGADVRRVMDDANRLAAGVASGKRSGGRSAKRER